MVPATVDVDIKCKTVVPVDGHNVVPSGRNSTVPFVDFCSYGHEHGTPCLYVSATFHCTVTFNANFKFPQVIWNIRCVYCGLNCRLG